MAISKKNKRQVLVDGKAYFWWVFDEYDQSEFDGIQLKVVCADQKHFFKYGLAQHEAHRKLVFALSNYEKLVHVSCPPKFENEDGIISNSGIVRMINWFKTENHQLQYAKDGMNNQLTDEEQLLLLRELRENID